MSREQVFPVVVTMEKKVMEGVSTLCFPYRAPLNEQGVLSTSIKLDEGSIIRADSESLRVFRSWMLLVGPILHQNGNHCVKYKVFVQKFSETKTAESHLKSKKRN